MQALDSARPPSPPVHGVPDATEVMRSAMDTARVPSAPLHVVLQPHQIVLPSAPTPADTVLYLSNIDRTVMFTVEIVFYYANDRQRASEKVGETLRDGLSRLLSGPYHFLTGRIVWNSEGRPQIACNRQGALFAEATASCTIEELGDVRRPKPEFKKLVLQAFYVKRLEELPLLLVQVTRFKCGGFVVGLGANHAVLDGIACVQFMQNYASVVRAEGLAMEPHPDRTCLKPRSPLRIEYEHDEFIKMSDLPPEVRFSFTTERLGHEGRDISKDIPPDERYVFQSFIFTKQDLDCLRKKAMEDGVLSGCRNFDLVTGHLWKIRAEVLELRPEQQSTVFYAVDIRKRMKPPLHPNFCGNGVFAASAREKAGELGRMRLSECVKRIQEATEAVTDEYVRSRVDWGEKYHGIPAVMEGCFFLSAWWRLGFDRADFGWGKPLYWSPVPNARVEFILLLPSTSRDECFIYLALLPHQIPTFERLLYPPY